MSNLPFASLGINLTGYRVTKSRLREWTKSKSPHTAFLHSNGGVFNSKGDGVYESVDHKFNDLESFWKYARKHKNGVMWRANRNG